MLHPVSVNEIDLEPQANLGSVHISNLHKYLDLVLAPQGPLYLIVELPTR